MDYIYDSTVLTDRQWLDKISGFNITKAVTKI